MSARNFRFAMLLLLGLNMALPADAVEGAALESPASICSQGGGSDGRSVLQSMQEKVKHMKGYSFDSDLTTFRGGKRIKEVGRLYFKSPNLVRFEVIKAGSRSGAVVVKQADGKIRGHMGGALSGIKVSLTPDSKILKSANGFSILESDLSTLLSEAKRKADSRLKCLASGGSVQNLQIVELLEGDGDVTDRIGVSPNQKLPEVWNLFSDSKLLSVLKFENLQARNDLPDSLFSMGGEGGESKAIEDDFEAKSCKIAKIAEAAGAQQTLSLRLLQEVEQVVACLRQESSGIKRSVSDLDARLKAGAEQGSASSAKATHEMSWPGNTRVKLMAGAINLENLLSALNPVKQAILAHEKSKGLPLTVSGAWHESLSACKNSVSELIDDAENDHPDLEDTSRNYSNLEKSLERLESARKQALDLL